MIPYDAIQTIAKRYQTEVRIVVREYIQHSFLSALYQIKASEQLLFKGGTALRVIYASPRFSEDVDFTGVNIRSARAIEKAFIGAISQLEQSGFRMNIVEAKETTGGYLGILAYQAYGLDEQMKFEVSLRRGKERGEVTTVTSDFLPPYTLTYVGGEGLARGKIAALLDRGKPRDWYDFYFILRHHELRRYVRSSEVARAREALEKTDINFKSVSVLLPQSHHVILKDFKRNLARELGAYHP